MREYNPGTAIGAQWLRPVSTIVSTPLTDRPSIQFNEEEATNIGDRAITRSWGPLVVQIDPQRDVPLLDAAGQPTGEVMSEIQIFAALHSMYVAAARRRDAVA